METNSTSLNNIFIHINRAFKMKNSLFVVSLIVSCLFTFTYSANILVLYPGSGKSHKIAVMPILEELAGRGHQITIVSAFKTATNSDNIRDIILPESTDFRHSKVFKRFEARRAKALFSKWCCYSKN